VNYDDIVAVETMVDRSTRAHMVEAYWRELEHLFHQDENRAQRYEPL
jgi:hypothetical protein